MVPSVDLRYRISVANSPERPSTVRITQLDASCLRSRKGRSSVLRNRAPYGLCKSGNDVDGEAVGSGMSAATQSTPTHLEAGNEVEVAR